MLRANEIGSTEWGVKTHQKITSLDKQVIKTTRSGLCTDRQWINFCLKVIQIGVQVRQNL